MAVPLFASSQREPDVRICSGYDGLSRTRDTFGEDGHDVTYNAPFVMVISEEEGFRRPVHCLVQAAFLEPRVGHRRHPGRRLDARRAEIVPSHRSSPAGRLHLRA